MSGRGTAIFVGAREPTIPANNWPSQKPAPIGIAILNDSTRYQAEPGNADPEEEPRLYQARQSKSDIDSQAEPGS
jgi:hypothetical protein